MDQICLLFYEMHVCEGLFKFDHVFSLNLFSSVSYLLSLSLFLLIFFISNLYEYFDGE